MTDDAAFEAWYRALYPNLVASIGIVFGAPALDGPTGELWQLVRALPARQRTAVVLRHVADLTEPEIGEAMGISRGGVSSTLRAAHSSLRRQLADVDDHPRRKGATT